MNSINKIINEKIHAVIRVSDADKVIEIARAVSKGGIKTIEIIVENPEIVKAIELLNNTEDITIAAGGIITQKQASVAISAGAKIIVSPVFQMNLVRLCQNSEIPLIMTATTPNEAYDAWKARTRLIKIYPTRPMGGAEYIEDLLRPMPFLNIIATGSIQIEGFTDYLEAGAKAVGIGRALYKNADAGEITQRAASAVSMLNSYLNQKGTGND